MDVEVSWLRSEMRFIVDLLSSRENDRPNTEPTQAHVGRCQRQFGPSLSVE